MPTAPTTSTKPRAKATRKPAAKANATATQSKATTAKSARTRAAHSAEKTLRQSETAARETAGVFGDYAERAVLIPVGAALIAREKVIGTVSDTLSSYSSSTRAQAQLRRFERRGVTARKRLEREVRKARVRVERELRQRRKDIESTVSDTLGEIDARRERIVKNGSDLAGRVPELASQAQERILSLV